MFTALPPSFQQEEGFPLRPAGASVSTGRVVTAVVANAFPCVSSQSPGHCFHPAGPGSLCIFSSLSVPARSSPQLSAFPSGPQSLGPPSCPSARGTDGHRPAAEDAIPRSARELEREGDPALDLACTDRPISSRSSWLVASVQLQPRNAKQGDGEWEASDVTWHRPSLKKGLGLTSLGRDSFRLSFSQHSLAACRTQSKPHTVHVPVGFTLSWGLGDGQ